MNKAGGFAAISLTAVFWALSIIATKICMEWFTPISLAAMRFSVASVFLVVIAVIRKDSLRIEKKDRKFLFLAGFVGIFLHFAAANVGIAEVSASLSAILLSFSPIFAVFIDRVFLKAKLTVAKIAGTALSVIGVVFVVGFNMEAVGVNTSLSVVLMLISALTLVVHSYILRKLQSSYSTIVITFYQSAIGSVCFLPFAIAMPMKTLDVSLPGIAAFLFLALVCSALCYVMYNYAIKQLDVVICSMFINLFPVVTIIVGVFFMGESVSPVQLIGAVLILGAVVFVSVNGMRRRI